MKDNICLVTTSLEEFWDKNKRILFLSEGCKVNLSDEQLKHLDFENFDFLWGNTDAIKEGIEFCNLFYKKMLPLVTKELNEVHEINNSEHYYHIILGNWLQHFIHVLYDKYANLKEIKNKYPNITTATVCNQEYVTLDYSDFVSKCFSSDTFNLQLYTDVIEFLEINHTAKTISKPLKTLEYFENKVSYKWKIFNIFNTITHLINRLFYTKSVLLTNVYFKYDLLTNMFKILFRGKFKYLFDDMNYTYKILVKIDHSARETTVLNFGPSEFEQLFSKLFLKYIPWIFFEGYKEFKNYVLNLPIKKPTAIFSANGIHGNNILKFYYAQYYNDIKMLYIMHGGYGFDYYNTPEEYEISCADQYYTIGKPQRNSIKHLPYMRFNDDALQSGEHILYAISEMSKYVYRLEFHAMSDSYLKYNLNWAQKLLKNIDQTIPIKLRMQNADNSFNSLKALTIENPRCWVDDFSNSFDIELKKCKLYITNNIATTYLEAMALNKPTIVMISKNVCSFREVAQPYMDMLEDVGILHYSTESAIEHVNHVYKNIDEWWLSDKVQNAKVEFLNMFMKNDEDWINKWLIELDKSLSAS